MAEGNVKRNTLLDNTRLAVVVALVGDNAIIRLDAEVGHHLVAAVYLRG